MIEWDYGSRPLVRRRDVLVPVEHIDNVLVMRIVDRLIDMGIYWRTRSVRITEERVEIEVYPWGLRAAGMGGTHYTRDYLYHWCDCPCRSQRCDGCGSLIVVRRSWPLLELLAGEDTV